MIIGISGGRGSFSEEAADAYVLLRGIEECTIDCLIFIEPLLTALEEGRIDVAIFAIENSNGGVVLEYLPAIGKHRFKVLTTFDIAVNHMLLVRPGDTHKDIIKIVSQKQALQQCRHYLRRAWSSAEIVESIDTATAAKDLSARKLPDGSAVIAARSCAKLFELEILEGPVQDLKYNYTTFIAAERLP